MNIAAIYDKYDLWGKVREDEALKDYIACEYCEGTGEVSAPHYTKGGEVPDCDFVTCKYCGGTGEK